MRGNLRRLLFRAKCNGPNGLSRDLTNIQSLMYFQLYDLPARGGNKKGPLARHTSTLPTERVFVNHARQHSTSRNLQLRLASLFAQARDGDSLLYGWRDGTDTRRLSRT
jgi:hypothetical protein